MLAKKINASKVAARKAAQEEKEKQQFTLQNRYIAKEILNAKKKQQEAFPSNEIESLTEIAQKVVAKNF